MTNEQAAKEWAENRAFFNNHKSMMIDAFLAGCSFVEERSISREDSDNFAISFAIWALYNPDAQALIAAKVTASQLLEKYKDRPYIDTNPSHQ